MDNAGLGSRIHRRPAGENPLHHLIELGLAWRVPQLPAAEDDGWSSLDVDFVPSALPSSKSGDRARNSGTDPFSLGIRGRS
jgi:hypothetical protein